MIRVFLMYNIRPEVSVEDWEKFLRSHDIPSGLALPSVMKYSIYRNSGDPVGPTTVQYVEEFHVTDLESFERDLESEEWLDCFGMWYEAGGCSWFMFYPEDVSPGTSHVKPEFSESAD